MVCPHGQFSTGQPVIASAFACGCLVNANESTVLSCLVADGCAFESWRFLMVSTDTQALHPTPTVAPHCFNTFTCSTDNHRRKPWSSFLNN